MHRDKAILGIDMVGLGLHRRGYRTQAGAAPLRETLACAIISRSGWDSTSEQALLDQCVVQEHYLLKLLLWRLM